MGQLHRRRTLYRRSSALRVRLVLPGTCSRGQMALKQDSHLVAAGVSVVSRRAARSCSFSARSLSFSATTSAYFLHLDMRRFINGRGDW